MSETWTTLTEVVSAWVKLPSGKFLNMAHVAEVQITGEGSLTLYFVGSGAVTFLKDADASFMLAWLDAVAES